MTKEEFIEKIAAAVAKYAPQYGVKVYSPVIAQACLESGYGTSNKAKHNNFFGMKYREGRLTCHSGTFVDGSSEQLPDGTYIPITDQWYEFKTLEDGVHGYFQYTNISRYSNLKGVTDPLTYLTNIRADGYATSLDYVKNVMAVVNNWNLTKYDKQGEERNNMSNSSLVVYTKLSPNHSGKRTHAIDRITPHCVAGQCTAETLGDIFASASRQASSNYGVDKDGRVGMYVEECNRSWCSSSNANDQRAVTIEVASDTTAPYAFRDAAYQGLIKLCVDICKRNGKTVLIWIDNKDKALAYEPKSNEMLLTVHRWFANKSCPGDWMYARMGDLASKVTAQLGGNNVPTEPLKQPDKPTNENTVKTFPVTPPFMVRVIIPDLNYRSEPSMSGKVNGQTGKGSFTIVEVKNGWGRLKSGVGWIWLENPSYCVIGASISPTAPVTPVETPKPSPYLVKVTDSALNIRKGPGTQYAVVGCIRNKGTYTIVETQSNWGRLKSGAGWICLNYTKKL